MPGSGRSRYPARAPCTWPAAIALHLRYGKHDRVIAHGSLVALSGSQLLFRDPHGHLVLQDLVHGGRDRRDRRARRDRGRAGRPIPVLPARRRRGAGGSTPTGPDCAPLRLARGATGTVASPAVHSWGDWTAWSFRRAGSRVSRWRNAARPAPLCTGCPPRRARSARAPADWSSQRRPAGSRWWAGSPGAVRAQLPGRAVPAVEGATVGWLRGGVPTVAAHRCPRAQPAARARQRRRAAPGRRRRDVAARTAHVRAVDPLQRDRCSGASTAARCRAAAAWRPAATCSCTGAPARPARAATAGRCTPPAPAARCSPARGRAAPTAGTVVVH